MANKSCLLLRCLGFVGADCDGGGEMNITHEEEIEGLRLIIENLREQLAFHIANHELLRMGMVAQSRLHERLVIDYEDAVNENAELITDQCDGDEVVH